MLTRLKVSGFKNLVDVDVAFGPFTCVAGANGVGKSNLFDAIRFLSALADNQPLVEAALSVRGEADRGTDVRSIFHRVGDQYDREMHFEAEMLVPPTGVDHLGQEARAAITFLRYELTLRLSETGLTIQRENLTHIIQKKARAHLRFPHRPVWRNSVVQGRRTSPFISTKVRDGKVHIMLHQDLGKGYRGGGRPRPHVADRLPRTVVSSASASENSTAVLARREMQSWRLLQLEPSALRSPDPYNASRSVASNGAHLPATLAHLAGWNEFRRHRGETLEDPEAVYARVANRLAELIDGVRSIRVDSDDRRELLTLMLTHCDRTEHEARSLSDGTLRFLALAILESDPAAQGVLCLEEPENGIHPERIPSMLHLLRDLAVDPQESVGLDNPLRQVIVNTHSPAVVGQVVDDDLLVAVPEIAVFGEHQCWRPGFRWLGDTWRAECHPEVPGLAPGVVVSYLNPLEPPEPDDAMRQVRRPRSRRVMDRPEIQKQLLLPGTPTQP